MVMRNRHDGPGGRDNLPRLIQERLRPRGDVRPADSPPAARRAWVGDAIILGLVFLAMAVTNLVVLVMALVILRGPVAF